MLDEILILSEHGLRCAYFPVLPNLANGLWLFSPL
jgi:hypothetical protein